MKETDLFEALKEYLEFSGYKVYSEVKAHPTNEAVADCVAIKDDKITVFELKTGFNITVFEQAMRWVGYAHFVYIVIPRRDRWVQDKYPHATEYLRQHGVGIIEVYDTDEKVTYGDTFHYGQMATEYPYPIKLEKWFYENIEHVEEFSPPGGTKGGGHITPYKITIHAVKEFLEANGSSTAREICEHVKTHYKSQNPHKCLAVALRTFESSWCVESKRGGKSYFKKWK